MSKQMQSYKVDDLDCQVLLGLNTNFQAAEINFDRAMKLYNSTKATLDQYMERVSGQIGMPVEDLPNYRLNPTTKQLEPKLVVPTVPVDDVPAVDPKPSEVQPK